VRVPVVAGAAALIALARRAGFLQEAATGFRRPRHERGNPGGPLVLVRPARPDHGRRFGGGEVQIQHLDGSQEVDPELPPRSGEPRRAEQLVRRHGRDGKLTGLEQLRDGRQGERLALLTSSFQRQRGVRQEYDTGARARLDRRRSGGAAGSPRVAGPRLIVPVRPALAVRLTPPLRRWALQRRQACSHPATRPAAFMATG
jgi:hypothetical protein